MQLKNFLVVGIPCIHMVIKDPVTNKVWRVSLNHGPFLQTLIVWGWHCSCPSQGSVLVSVWPNQKPQSSLVEWRMASLAFQLHWIYSGGHTAGYMNLNLGLMRMLKITSSCRLAWRRDDWKGKWKGLSSLKRSARRKEGCLCMSSFIPFDLQNERGGHSA